MTLTIAHITPIVALIAGILILLMPRLLNFIVAIYLIVVGLVGLNGIYHFMRLRRRLAPCDLRACAGIRRSDHQGPAALQIVIPWPNRLRAVPDRKRNPLALRPRAIRRAARL